MRVQGIYKLDVTQSVGNIMAQLPKPSIHILSLDGNYHNMLSK
jgi:hypothetical protein